MLEPCEGKLSRTVLRGESGSNIADLLDQILENKQRFISQVMTSKSPARSCEDVDDATLKFAEVKALASGNPLIMEKVELDTAVTKLKLLKANHIDQHYRLEDALLKTYPKEIAACQALIDGLTADIATVKGKMPADTDHFAMTIGGKVYTERKEAGTAIIAACAGMKAVEKSGAIGEYAGFALHVSFDSFSQQFKLTVKGKTSHTIDVGTDPSGNITRINNVLTGLENAKAKAEERLEGLHSKVAAAQEELARPFPQEAELAEKQARLNEVNARLNMDTGSTEQEKGQSEKDVEGTPNEVATITPIASQPQAAYADQPKRPSLLQRLHSKQGQVSESHPQKLERKMPDKSQSI